ncbi:MAG: Rrf2 family transcriptional regulator [Rhodospirillaceae bacterium]|jgi:Rrf2 family transcriptional regulator, nitric oxide-sensitive transcriptional repressor|nr:Rrf2 family transcriptional regulator [Rhodospirillaceae bacterium]
MHLTRYTDYALRTLIYLGINEDRTCTIPEIAKRYNISRNHLMKIVHQLGTAGILETVRGRGGGIRLGQLPADLTVGSVVRITEENLNIVECFDPTRNQCQISASCVLASSLYQALGAFMEVLDKVTLADLIKPEKKLALLLGLDRA